MRARSLAWPLLSLAVSCGGDSAGPEPRAVHDARIRPAALLLSPGGPGQALRIEATDAEGAAIEPQRVVWSSQRPDAVTVDDDGTVRPGAAPGAALVFATVDGVRTEAAFVLVADPAPGVKPVTDDDIIEGPYDLDDAPFGQYGVTVRAGAPLTVGDRVLGTGEAPLAGEVLEARDAPDGLELVVALRPLGDLFTELAFELQASEAELPLTLPAEVTERYDVVRHEDGRVELTERAIGTSTGGLSRRALEFSVGPFSCETADPISLGFTISPSVTLDPTLDLRVRYDAAQGGLQELTFASGLTLTAAVQTQLTAQAQAKVTCTQEIMAFTLPFGGPIALFLGGQVPLGVGLEGELVVPATVGMQASLQAGFSSRIGVVCDAGACEMVNEFDPVATGSVDPIVVTPNRLEMAGFAFGYAQFSLGSPLLRSLRFDAFEVKAGLRLEGKLPFGRPAQAADPTFAGEYKLLFVATAGAASSFQSLLGFLSITSTNLEAKFEAVLDASPTGTIQAEATEVAPGTPVALSVELTDTDFLGLYNVQRVELYRVVSDDELALVATVPAAPEQFRFEAEWTPTEEDLGRQRIYAFVVTERLPVPLEIGPDAKVDVDVVAPSAGRLQILSRGADVGAGLTATLHFNGEGPEPRTVQMSDSTTHPENDLTTFEAQAEVRLPAREVPAFEATQTAHVTATNTSSVERDATGWTIRTQLSLDAAAEATHTYGGPPNSYTASVMTYGSASHGVVIEVLEGRFEARTEGTLSFTGPGSATFFVPGDPRRRYVAGEADGTVTLDSTFELSPGRYTLGGSFEPRVAVSRYGGTSAATGAIDVVVRVRPLD